LFSTATLNVTLDSDGNTFAMTGVDLAATAYTDALTGSVATTTSAQAALDLVKSAINQLASDRATIGAFQSRLNFTSDQLTISKENLSAASSRIQDVDVADEATQYARFQILVQSGTAMLAQANQLPQTVLRLLQ
jgi:flagellin